MTGHIQQIGKGHWKIVIEAGRNPATGKRKRLVRYFHGRKQEAEAFKAQLIADLSKGEFIEPSKITISEWLDTWLNTYKRADLRLTTWESYEVLIRNHINPAIGAIRLQELRPEHLQKLYNDKAAEGKSAQTIRHIHKVIHGALEQALKNRLIQVNVSNATTLPKIARREIKTLSLEQQEAFSRALEGDRLGTAFMMLLGTGLRRGELLGLEWQDVNLEEGTIYIRQEMVWTKEKGFTYQPPKTDKSKRLMPLPQVVIDALKGHQQKMKSEGNCHPHKPVFCTTNGNLIIPRNFNRKFYELCKKAGIEGINLHALSHTFATRLLEARENLKVVQELLGHSRISTTADIYSHVAPDIKRQAINKLNDLLSGTKMAPKTIPGTDADAGNP